MYKNVEDFVNKQENLIELEKNEEQSEWEVLLKRCSLKELEKQGLCIRNVQTEEEKTGMFGRYVVTFGYSKERKNNLHTNKFTTGDNVGVYLNKVESHSKIDASGIVLSSKSNTITIVFEEEFDTSNTHYQLVLLPNDVTYRRFKKVLHLMVGASTKQSSSHIQTLIPFKQQKKPNNILKQIHFFNDSLDDSQKEAVKFVLSTNEIVSIIHGPPGTGKTTTIIEVIRQAHKDHLKMLVCAPSNIAVDNLVEKLSLCSMKIVRLGHPARTSSNLHKHCLDAQLMKHDSSELISDARNDVKNVLNQMTKCKSKQERIALRNDLKELKKEVIQREKKAMKEILKGADVVLSTTNSAVFDGPLKHLEENHFDLLVIDEAAQALEVSCWIPLMHVSRCILAGDHQQLPPTIKSEEASHKGLSVTLMERVINEGNLYNVAMLTMQYRMHERIMQWSSQQFYENKLEAASSVCRHLLKDLDNIECNEVTTAPLVFLDTAGHNMYEVEEDDFTQSKSNEHEVAIIKEHLDGLIDSGVKQTSIGIITPYNRQVELLRAEIHGKYPKVEINSVDGFQGREKEAILISLVRSNVDREVGFLSDYRRMNVAITRARRHLFIVGDSSTISSHSVLASFCNYLYKFANVKSPKANKTIEQPSNELMEKCQLFFKDLKVSENSKIKKQNTSRIKGQTKEKSDNKLPEENNSSTILTSSSNIESTIENFMASNSKDYSFPTSLTSKDRALIHELADQYGLLHESHGEGKQRYIFIKKSSQDSAKNNAEGSLQAYDETKQCSSKEPPEVDKSKDNFAKENNMIKKKTAQKNKKKKKVIDRDVDNDDDDGIDQFLLEASRQNDTCFYSKCNTKTRTLGQNCSFCSRRFCIAHYVAEVHGCGSAAAAHAKRKINTIHTLHQRPTSSSSSKRENAQRKLHKTISDMEAKRKNNKAKKK